MNQSIILIVVIALALFSCSKNEQDTNPLAKLVPEVQGWSLEEAPRYYIYENLSDYMNGNCEQYFSYDFKGLISARFQKDDNPELVVTVDIYDLGTPLNAYGVYSKMTYPDYEYGTYGCETIISSQMYRFWQDRYEIEITNMTGDDNMHAILANFSEKVSQKLPACKELTEATWLPKTNQADHTQRYIAKKFLDQDFLPGGFVATYKIDDVDVQGFVTKCKNIDDAENYFNKYKNTLADRSENEITEGKDSFKTYNEYTGYMFVGLKENWLYGASSRKAYKSCVKIAEEIEKNIPVAKTN